MKKLIPKTKVLLLFVFLALTLLLTGCVKRSDATYFLRGLSNSYQITYTEGDRSTFVSNDIHLDNNFRGADVTWVSSHPDIININGEVNLPPEDTEVELTATFSVDNTKISKKFLLNVVSKKSIQNYYYNQALNLIMVLETRNNLTNYNNAKLAFQEVDVEHESYQSLKERYETQEKIFLLNDEVKYLEENLNTTNYNEVNTKIQNLPQTNNYVTQFAQKLHLLEDYLMIGDQVFATIDNKTMANYDSVLPLVEAMPSNNASKKGLLTKLEMVKSYLDNVALLESNLMTQEELEEVIDIDLENSVILESERQNLQLLYNNNQERLNNADLERFAYINQKLDSLKQSFNDNDLLKATILIDNYTGLGSDELVAKLNIIIMLNDITLDNINAANQKNALVLDEVVRLENQIIIHDYQRVYNLSLLILELEEHAFVNFDLQKNHEKITEASLIADELVLDENISWYQEKFELYLAINKVYLDANLIIDASFDKVGNDYELITKITEAKKGYTLRPISSPENKTISTNLQLYIRELVFAKSNELIELNKEVPSDNNRVLLGQLINQAESNEYRLLELKTYKEELDRAIRVKGSTSLITKIIIIFIAIIIFLVLQAMTADYASKKGYEGLGYSLIALIPIGGFIYFYKKPKRRNISKSGIKQVYKPKEILGKVVIYAQIVLVSVIVLIPIIYIFGMAFSDMKTDIPNTIWPKNPNWNAFNFLLTETKFKQWWINTALIALINMLIGTVLITGAAYVFARFSFKGKKAGLLTILVLQSFPSFMGLIAMYVLFWKFGLLGRPIYLTILYIGGGIPGNVWLIKGFMDQIPRDLDESAMIDGANKLQIFVRIIMPLAIPILTFVAVGMFMAPWMDYMLPGYLLNVPKAGAGPDYDITQQWTLAVGLFKFINDNNTLNYSAFAAGALIVGMPITILYMFFQKYLIEGIMAGATKG